jgi:hypothetical protein
MSSLYSSTTRPPLIRARIRKRLRNLGIDSLELTSGSLNVYEFGLWARYSESLKLLTGNAYLYTH